MVQWSDLLLYRPEMLPTGEHVAVNKLLAYLDGAEEHGREWATGPAPLRQEVRVPSGWWRSFANGLVLPDPVREGVLQAVDRIEERRDVVDRTLLTELAHQAGSSSAGLVSCWFTVMSWGAGPQNRARLRQWTRALPSEGFVEALGRSHALLAIADLPGAYQASRLPGVGQSYLTKWLWVLGLPGRIGEPRPYILDRYVWQSLRRLAVSPTGRNEAGRWVDYCRALDRWAMAVNAVRPSWHVDGDRIEQLLFDRGEGLHLYEWLGK